MKNLSTADSEALRVRPLEPRDPPAVVLSIESHALPRLRYLRVTGDAAPHAPVAKALAETAIRRAWDAGCLKLVVHPHIPATHVIEYMHEVGFEFARTHSSGSERVAEFSRNVYEPPRDPSSRVGHFQRIQHGVNL